MGRPEYPGDDTIPQVVSPPAAWCWCWASWPALLAAAKASGEDEILRLIEDVVLGPEYGGSGAIRARWVHTPSLSVVEGTAPEREMIAACVGEINSALARTSIREIRIDRNGHPQADVLVCCVPQKELPALAREHAFQYGAGNLGCFWTFWNDRHEIQSGVVLLASDRLTADLFHHFALEEITQVLGLSGDSPFFAESIFYSQGNDRGSAEHLSSLDVQLIDFFAGKSRRVPGRPKSVPRTGATGDGIDGQNLPWRGDQT